RHIAEREAMSADFWKEDQWQKIVKALKRVDVDANTIRGGMLRDTLGRLARLFVLHEEAGARSLRDLSGDRKQRDEDLEKEIAQCTAQRRFLDRRAHYLPFDLVADLNEGTIDSSMQAMATLVEIETGRPWNAEDFRQALAGPYADQILTLQET